MNNLGVKTTMKNKGLIFLFSASLNCVVFSPFVFAADDHSIADRLKPVGKVNIAAPVATTAGATTTPTTAIDGEKTYKQFCTACHNTGVAGAPKAGEWGKYIGTVKTELKKAGKPDTDKAIKEALVQIAVTGKGAMPAKGTCSTCTNADLQAAIEYMLKLK